MMLQQSVGYMPARGLPGNPVNPSEVVHLHYNPLSDGSVKAGCFAFAADVEQHGEKFGYCSATGNAGQYPLGLVVRNLIGHMMDVRDSSTETYFAGQHVTIAKRGQFYVFAPEGAVAKDGDKVYINPVDGKLAFEATDGYVVTGWYVRCLNGMGYAEEDEIIVIENWG